MCVSVYVFAGARVIRMLQDSSQVFIFMREPANELYSPYAAQSSKPVRFFLIIIILYSLYIQYSFNTILDPGHTT